MKPEINDSTTAVSLERAGSRFDGLVSVIAWTAAGVGTLFLLGKLIGLATRGMPYGCWQSTAARAAASTLVVGSLVAVRRGNLALLGAAYAAVLATSHMSPLLLLSAALAGVGAFAAAWFLRDRNLWLRAIVATLAFNLLLTTSGFIKALAATNGRTGLPEYTEATGLRVLTTLVVTTGIVLTAKLVARR